MPDITGVLTSGVVEIAAGDHERLPMDFGDIPELIALLVNSVGDYVADNTAIASYTITCAGLTVSSLQKDFSYQISAKFSGGTAGRLYSAVFTIVLNDADSTTIRRTGIIKCK